MGETQITASRASSCIGSVLYVCGGGRRGGGGGQGRIQDLAMGGQDL